ncbi:MAG: poly-beta-hydroxybutyrate polymerase N-terminal domain-containing protein, partial [Alphaproteobacteria bacterium]|nr:poly-beta-hydroxybutyrate polymerase N-terminal domain-containing protein [Alphaproteobacteria bacterium]
MDAAATTPLATQPRPPVVHETYPWAVPGRDSYASTAMADIVDRSLHAAMARFTAGLSPASLAGAYLDWAAHLAFSPGKQMLLLDKARRKMARLASYMGRCALGGGQTEPCIEPLAQDRRFRDEAWDRWPYNVMSQAFLLQQQWWHNATTSVRGVTARDEAIVEFAARQLLDMVSPSNFPLTNPEIFWRTLSSGGANLALGFQNFVEDWERAVSGRKPAGPEKFAVGHNLAVTPGKVIY